MLLGWELEFHVLFVALGCQGGRDAGRGTAQCTVVQSIGPSKGLDPVPTSSLLLPSLEGPVGHVGFLGKASSCSISPHSLVTRAIDKRPIPNPQQAAVSLSARCTK